MRWALPLVAALLVGAIARGETLNIETAKDHFAAGKAYYDEKRWDDALREFREAYRLSKKPALLYNIALCNERLHDYEQATGVLREYLRLDPSAEGRPAIEKKIADLDALRQAEQAERAGGGKLAGGSAGGDKGGMAGGRAPPVRRRVATWAIGAVGLALLGAAAGTGVAAHFDFQTLADQCGPNRDLCPPGFEATRDRGQALEWATYGLLAAGGVAVISAVVLFFVEGRPRAEAKTLTITPVLLPAGAGAAALTRF